MSIEYVELTIEDAAPIEITISDIPEAGPGGGGSSLTIREADGTPSGVVTELVFPNTSVSIASGVGTLSVVPLFDTSITGGRNAFIVEPPPVAGQQANLLFESHSGPSGDDFGIARIVANAEEGIQLVAKGNGGSDPSYNLSVLPTGYAVTQASNFRTAIDAAASSHTHGNISNAGAIGTTADLPISTTASGVINTRTVADFRGLLGLATTDSPTFAAITASGSSSGTLDSISGTGFNARLDWNLGLLLKNSSAVRWSSGNSSFTGHDLLLFRDAAGVLAQRNGTNAQISRVYKTFTSSTNFETLEFDAASDASNYRIGSRIGSTGGTTRGLQLGRYDAAGAWTSWLGIGTTGRVSLSNDVDVLIPSAASTRETILRARISDASNDAFQIYNGTILDSGFLPGFSGSRFSSSGTAIIFNAMTDAANDTGTSPMMIFEAKRTSSQTDPNNGTHSAITTRPLFSWITTGSTWMQMFANGNLALNSTTDNGARLQVTGTVVTTSDLTIIPSSSRTLSTNGQFTIEMTSNTAGNLVYRGSDGTTRRMALTFS